MANPDYYAILQVHPEADKEVISAAYRKLAAKHHPDVSASLGAADKMKLLNEAYEVLSNPPMRSAYDRSRGIMSGKVVRSGMLLRRFVAPIGVMVFFMTAARLGIRLALMLLLLAVVIWIVVKLWK